jgi:hypothetical protein
LFFRKARVKLARQNELRRERVGEALVSKGAVLWVKSFCR